MRNEKQGQKAPVWETKKPHRRALFLSCHPPRNRRSWTPPKNHDTFAMTPGLVIAVRYISLIVRCSNFCHRSWPHLTSRRTCKVPSTVKKREPNTETVPSTIQTGHPDMRSFPPTSHSPNSCRTKTGPSHAGNSRSGMTSPSAALALALLLLLKRCLDRNVKIQRLFRLKLSSFTRVVATARVNRQNEQTHHEQASTAPCKNRMWCVRVAIFNHSKSIWMFLRQHPEPSLRLVCIELLRMVNPKP